MINTKQFCESVCMKAKLHGFELMFTRKSNGYVHHWRHAELGIIPTPTDTTHVDEPRVALFLACEDLSLTMGWNHS